VIEYVGGQAATKVSLKEMFTVVRVWAEMSIRGWQSTMSKQTLWELELKLCIRREAMLIAEIGTQTT
jgi:hypothetical protein